MDEEVRLVPKHGSVGPHATPSLVDPPALAGSVAGPNERYAAIVGGSGTEMTDRRLAEYGRLHQVLRRDPIEDVLAGREAGQTRLPGQVVLRQRIHVNAADYRCERLGSREFNAQPRGLADPSPNDGTVAGDIARLQPMRDGGPIGGTANRGPEQAWWAKRHKAGGAQHAAPGKTGMVTTRHLIRNSQDGGWC